MALVQFATKMHSSFIRLSYRNFSVTASKTVDGVKPMDVKKSVFISQSTDIFTNLALEDWLYRNVNLTNHHILMLWRNDPCVVIGRHQNPWNEANVPNLSHITTSGVQLARRNTAGGTVYNDQGNLNMTFFTPKNHYNRNHNLELITRAIFREYGVKIDISPMEDLVIRNSQVSGNAAKLGQLNAYHHCNLMVSVDKVDLREALQKLDTGINTNASKSAKSKVMNLCEENPKINISSLLAAIGWEYMRTPANSRKDCGKTFANQQNGFQMVNPTERWFPGLSKLRQNLCDWEWCYGETPKFTISKTFPIPIHHSYNSINGGLSITMVVEQGRISDVSLHVPPGLSSTGFNGEATVITSLKNHKFTEDVMNTFESLLSGNEYGFIYDKDKFITECVRQVMTSV